MTAPSRQPPVAGPEQVRAGYRRFAGVRTRVLEVGPQSADPPRTRRLGHRRTAGRERAALPPRLVLLHGYCDSADTWLPALAELGTAGHRAVAVDLPGFGEADRLRQSAVLPQLDAFVAALVREQAAAGDVVLVGNSLGGTMALRAAQQELPVAGVVSIAAPGLVDSWLVRTIGRYPIPLRLYASLPLPVPAFVVRAVAGKVVPRLLYADLTTADAAQVRRFTDLFPDYRSTLTRLHQARQLVAELTEAYRFERVHVPLLVVACGKDRLVSLAAGKRLHGLVPHSRLLVRHDWGHCPQLDDPREIAEVLASFAAGIRAEGGGTSRGTGQRAAAG